MNELTRNDAVAVFPTDHWRELQPQIRSVMRFLRPHRIANHSKIRMGRPHDGGYVCIDDFHGIDTALSLGINDDISWDLEAADRGLKIFQFDHTVEDLAPDDARMVFEKKMIAPAPAEGAETLENLILTHDKGSARPNIFLKMDIEGSEWKCIEATNLNALGRISQITCELHGFERLYDLDWRLSVYNALKKLNEHYVVAHLHGNNFAALCTIANVAVPSVIEVTFVNRQLYVYSESDELIPGPLDQTCDPNQSDIFLGDFRF